MTVYKEELAKLTNPAKIQGDIAVAMSGADVFIGLSGKGLLHKDHVMSMAPKAIVFALANPEPEILPDVVLERFRGSGGGGMDGAVAGAGREIFRLNRGKSALLLTIG